MGFRRKYCFNTASIVNLLCFFSIGYGIPPQILFQHRALIEFIDFSTKNDRKYRQFIGLLIPQKIPANIVFEYPNFSVFG